MTDWAEAGRVASIGFGIVFVVLILLALAVRGLGLMVRLRGRRIGDKGSPPEPDRKEG